jgi:septal ring factor EnvC (AmiA/AmiB activator)
MKQNLMKHTKRQLITFLCLVGTIFLSGTFSQAASQDDVKKEMKEASSAIADYSVDQKDKAVAEAKELMNKLDQNINDAETSMKENWHSLEESSKQNYELSKTEFKKQREELAGWLDKMQNSSADAWEETKKGFADAHDSLSSSWKKATEKMTQD